MTDIINNAVCDELVDYRDFNYLKRKGIVNIDSADTEKANKENTNKVSDNSTKLTLSNDREAIKKNIEIIAKSICKKLNIESLDNAEESTDSADNEKKSPKYTREYIIINNICNKISQGEGEGCNEEITELNSILGSYLDKDSQLISILQYYLVKDNVFNKDGNIYKAIKTFGREARISAKQKREEDDIIEKFKKLNQYREDKIEASLDRNNDGTFNIGLEIAQKLKIVASDLSYKALNSALDISVNKIRKIENFINGQTDKINITEKDNDLFLVDDPSNRLPLESKKTEIKLNDLVAKITSYDERIEGYDKRVKKISLGLIIGKQKSDNKGKFDPGKFDPKNKVYPQKEYKKLSLEEERERLKKLKGGVTGKDRVREYNFLKPRPVLSLEERIKKAGQIEEIKTIISGSLTPNNSKIIRVFSELPPEERLKIISKIGPKTTANKDKIKVLNGPKTTVKL